MLPAVVSIEVRSSAGSGTGSGVVIDRAGYVLTNNHVISAAAANRGSNLRALFSDQSAAEARVVGRDPKSDLAVLKVDKPGLTVAALGDSSKIAVGDPVIAIGSPLGLAGTVTSGIVSALNRPVRLGGGGGGSGSDTNAVINAIQTDAPINPGNSGGALVDGAGAVVGINSAIATLSSGQGQSGSIGVGFAIPINEARDIAQQLIRTGKVQHATLGRDRQVGHRRRPGRCAGREGAAGQRRGQGRHPGRRRDHQGRRPAGRRGRRPGGAGPVPQGRREGGADVRAQLTDRDRHGHAAVGLTGYPGPVFGTLGWLEIVTLLVVALLVFGPDKLPGVVRDAAQLLRQLRTMAKGARTQIKSELGPEFSDFDLDSLNPRTFVRKNLFEDDEEDERVPDRAEPPPRSQPRAPGEQAPYDPDTT